MMTPNKGYEWPYCFLSPSGSAADFVVLDDTLHVQATYISGELVWQAEEAGL